MKAGAHEQIHLREIKGVSMESGKVDSANAIDRNGMESRRVRELCNQIDRVGLIVLRVCVCA